MTALWKMSLLPNWMRADVMGARIQRSVKSVCRVQNKNLWIPEDLWRSKLMIINLFLHNNIKEAAAKIRRQVLMKQAKVMSCPPDILSRQWWDVLCEIFWNAQVASFDSQRSLFDFLQLKQSLEQERAETSNKQDSPFYEVVIQGRPARLELKQ